MMMKNNNSLYSDKIKASEIVYFLFIVTMKIALVSLPKNTVRVAHQDGWISIIISLIYPSYLLFLASFISKKCPDENVLSLSKKYFGKIIGSIANFIFMSFFIFLIIIVSNNYNIELRTIGTSFLNPNKIFILLFFLVSITASKKLKSMSSMSKVLFFIVILLILTPFQAIKDIKIQNMMPIFGSGIVNILKSTAAGIYAFWGVEVFFIIYPQIEDKNHINKNILLLISLICLTYIWVVLGSILYLGPDIVKKSNFPFMLLTHGIDISLINNYQVAFIAILSLVTFLSLSGFYYCTAAILHSYLANKISFNKILIGIFPLILFLSMKFGKFIINENIKQYITIFYSIFNVIFITAIALFTLLKGDEKLG